MFEWIKLWHVIWNLQRVKHTTVNGQGRKQLRFQLYQCIFHKPRPNDIKSGRMMRE